MDRKKRKCSVTLGTEQGHPVKEIIATAEEITGKPALIKFSPLNRVYAASHVLVSSRKAHEELDWKAEYDLERIIASAWNWQTKYPNGYASKSEFAL